MGVRSPSLELIGCLPINPHSTCLTGENEVSALGDLHDLALLDELTDSSTSAGTVDLQAVHNGVDGDELHLRMTRPIYRTNLRDLSEELVVIGLLEVDLVIDGISLLILAPLLNTSFRTLKTLPSFRWRTIREVSYYTHNSHQTQRTDHHTTYHFVIN